MWFAEAPSNIALIKYMGKASGNIPSNTSLSFTLDKLISRVEISEIDDDEDKFQTLDMVGFLELDLSNMAIERFKNHLIYLKHYFNCEKHFLIKSGNNFPNDVGIASSASSFAALTRCVVKAMVDLGYSQELDKQQMSSLSRHGSGSSCRSFFAPWAIWEKEYAEPIDLPYGDLLHSLCLINTEKKKISSSKAHELVRSSLLFSDRPRRANQRTQELISAMRHRDWLQMFLITWADFFDMHSMFETCAQPFGYIGPTSLRLLVDIKRFWHDTKDGPLVTVDAGPNIHLLWRPDQSEQKADFEGSCDCDVF